MFKATLLSVVVLAAAVGSAFASDSFLGIFPKALYGKGGSAVITCQEGRIFLQSKGYSVDMAVDCSPRFYTYLAGRQNISYFVTVDSRFPRIIAASRSN
jgi:hypothetical protein